MNTETLALDIHGLVRVRGTGLTPELAAALRADYGTFAMDSLGDADRADLALAPLTPGDPLPAAFRRPKSHMDGRVVAEHGGGLHAAVLRRGRPDVILSLEPPFRLLFTPRAGCAAPVLDMLFVALDAVLRRRADALLCKGAVAVRGDRAVVLTGVSGAGKTSILLHLLHQGWDYISDNTFVLHRGRALTLRRHLVMHRYHLEHFGELVATVPHQSAARALVRRGLKAAMPLLPVVLQRSAKVHRLADPFVRLQPEAVRPDLHVPDGADIAAWAVLAPGAEYSFAPIQREALRDRLRAVLELSHADYHHYRRLCAVYGGEALDTETSLVDRNLGGGAAYAAHVPGGKGFAPARAALCRALAEILEAAS